MATPDIMAQLQALLLAQVQGQTAAQSSTRSELEKLLANPGTPIEAMPATGLSPEALAALRGRAIDAVPGRYDQAQRNLTANLSSRGLLSGPNAAAGDTSRLFGMLASEREKTRAGSLRDVTLANETAYNQSLDRNEVMRSAREKERLTQLQQLIQGYGTSLQSSDPNGALGLLNQQGISAADNVSRENIANAELKVRMATSDSDRAARQAELDSLNARAAAQLSSNNTNSAADRAITEAKLRMDQETHRLDIIKQQQALSGQVPGQVPQTNAPGTVNNLVTGNVPLANLTAQQQADKLQASLFGGAGVYNYGILGPVKPLPSIQNFGNSGLGTVVPPVDPTKVPGKAAGGPVSGGKYIVGERGPEVLTMEPGSEGYVYPNSLFKQLMHHGGMPGRAGGGPVGFREGSYDFGHLSDDPNGPVSQVSGDELAQYLDSPHYAPEPDRAGAQAFLGRNQPSVGESLANSLTKNPERSQALQMLLDRVLPKGKGQVVGDQNIEVPYKTVGDHEVEQRQAFEQLQQRMAQAEIQNKLMQYAPKPDQLSGQAELLKYVSEHPEFAGLAQRMFGKTAPHEPAVEDDRAYRALIQKKELGIPLSPQESASMKAYETQKELVTSNAATLRNEGYGNIRMGSYLDTKNGNAPIALNANQINESNKNEPGRYIPAGVGTPALTKTALIEDIRGGSKQVREALQNPKLPEFNLGSKTKIAVAMRDRNPSSAISALITGEAGQSMTPEQQDYLINLSNLVENAMAMRSVLGAGQGSDDLRNAIRSVIPGPTTPNKGYAIKQLDVFEKTLDRLERGIPTVKLNGAQGGDVATQVKNAKIGDVVAGHRKTATGWVSAQ